MKFTIIDKRHIQKGEMLASFIESVNDMDSKMATQALNGLLNIDKIVENETEFIDEGFVGSNDDKIDDKTYIILYNSQIGIVIVREDNVKCIFDIEDVYHDYGIDRIITSGDTTVLIDTNGKKYKTTRCEEDYYDIEKAVMILLLKREGYDIKDVYDIIKSLTK